ncbi:MAG: hypothetical protein FJZ01_26995 [Candidatus Sericytochromatia bacterium]|nr:hypothetical protein [Candidatus Tanganyikabacteria bacterium]
MPQPINYLGLVWGDLQARIREALVSRYELKAESEAALTFRGSVAQEPAGIEALFTGGELDRIVIRIDTTDREDAATRRLLTSLFALYEHRHGPSASRPPADSAGSPALHGEWQDAQACLRLATVTEARRRFVVIAYARLDTPGPQESSRDPGAGQQEPPPARPTTA